MLTSGCCAYVGVGACAMCKHIVSGLIDLKELAAWMTVNHAERILQLTPEEVTKALGACRVT
jgi:hypothetical protein